MPGTYQAPNNVFPIDPTLADLLVLLKKDVMLTLNCHAIGTVQDFNGTTQTATVKFNYAKVYTVNGPQGYQTELRDYPVLADCPVIFLGGGDACLTFPVTEGDECLLCFNDRDLDNWFTSSGVQPNSNRLHSVADAVAIVGLRSKAEAITNFDPDRAVLRKGNALVGVGKNNELVKIANETYTLNQLLQDLITAVKNITVGPGTFANSGVAVTGTSGTPLNVGTLRTIASELDNLLE